MDETLRPPIQPELQATEAAMGGPIEGSDLVGGAVRGAVILVGRNLGVQALAFVATIGLARLLSPAEFGAFAVAQAIQAMGIVIVDFGLPAALIRREQEPTTEELRTAAGLVLAIGIGLSALALVVGFAILPALGSTSEIAKLAAVASLSFPILGIQIVPIVRLNRRLDYGSIALIEITDSVAFYATALFAAAAGLGSYSLAGAAVVAVFAGMLVTFRIEPWRPGFALNLQSVRKLAAFGFQVGLLQAATLLRELGLVALLAGLSGAAMAGFYGMSRRLFSLPFAAMNALQRVGMTALSRVPRGPTRALQAAKAAAVGTLAVGLPMALIAGAATPLVAFVFGDRWVPAANLTAAASPGVLVFAAAGTMVLSMQLADGNARIPLVGILLQLITIAGLAVALVPDHGATGAGIALGAGFLVFTVAIVALGSASARRVAAAAWRGIVVALAAGLAGRAIAGAISGDAVAAAASLAATAASWAAMAAVACRADLRLMATLVRRHFLPVRSAS